MSNVIPFTSAASRDLRILLETSNGHALRFDNLTAAEAATAWLRIQASESACGTRFRLLQEHTRIRYFSVTVLELRCSGGEWFEIYRTPAAEHLGF